MSKYVPHWCSWERGQRGVAILIRRALLQSGQVVVKGERQCREGGGTQGVQGRFLTLQLAWGGQQLALACVYAPSGAANASAQRTFLQHTLAP